MQFKMSNIRLLVSNFKECFLFYRDMMGFTPTFGNEDDVYADFDAGSIGLALFDKYLMSKTIGSEHLPVTENIQDKFCLVFEVDDADLIYNTMKSKGVVFITQPQDRPDWGLRTAHFCDPDGNLIEIFQSL